AGVDEAAGGALVPTAAGDTAAAPTAGSTVMLCAGISAVCSCSVSTSNQRSVVAGRVNVPARSGTTANARWRLPTSHGPSVAVAGWSGYTVAPCSVGRLSAGSVSDGRPVALSFITRLIGWPTCTGVFASGQPESVRLSARAGSHADLPQSAGAACTGTASAGALADTGVPAPKKLSGSLGSSASPWK